MWGGGENTVVVVVVVDIAAAAVQDVYAAFLTFYITTISSLGCVFAKSALRGIFTFFAPLRRPAKGAVFPVSRVYNT